MELFNKWGTKHVGLFTFAQSQKHVGLYQNFGFWPRFLTAIMSKPIEHTKTASEWAKFSEVPANDVESALSACREVTNSIYEGLDLEREILAVAAQALGETILLWDDNSLVGLAVCHNGPGTEAGSGACYIKFGAVASRPTAAQDFNRLIDACEQWAASRNSGRIVAGVNTARHEAYRALLACGFKTDMQGVVMSKPNEAGYNRPGVYLVDDWR